MNKFVIQNINVVIQNINDTSQLWSETEGWIDNDNDNFDVYSLSESETMELPENGQWVRLYSFA
jgi:hypothetical protein